MPPLLASLSFLISLLLTSVIRSAALKTGFVDKPEGELKEHKAPVPYAGAAIFLTFAVLLVGVRIFTSYPTGTLRQLRGILIGGGLVFLMGMLDDLCDLDYRFKFLVQGIAAGILIHYGIYIRIFPLPFLNTVFTVLWVLLIVNSLNIIDILDGLAPGVAAIASLGFFAVTLPGELIYVNVASLVLFGVLSGFWFLNKPPAKAFMGDAGSLSAGFVLAALSMGAEYSGVNILGLFAPIFILLVPVYDTFLVIYFRYRAGRPVFKGSRDHFAVRLTSAGFSKWSINLISYGATLLFSFAAYLVTRAPGPVAFLVIAFVFFLALAGSSLLGGIDPYRSP